MSSGFVKLDSAILTSSLWFDRDMRSVFITALLMAEPIEVREPIAEIKVRSLDHTGWMVPPGWYGFVPAAGVGIVRLDGTDKDEGMDALERLAAADPDSRSSEHEGRRMVRVNGGYLILNYFKYRDKDFTAAERSKRYRERQKERAKAVKPVTCDASDEPPTVTEPSRDSYVISRKQKQKQKQSSEAEITTTTTTSSPPAREPGLSDVTQILGLTPKQIVPWSAILNGMTEGLGTAGMKSVPWLVQHEAAQELAAAGGDVTVPRFKAFVRKILERGNPPPEKQFPPRPRNGQSSNGPPSTRESRSHAALESWLAKKETTDAEVVTDGEH